MKFLSYRPIRLAYIYRYLNLPKLSLSAVKTLRMYSYEASTFLNLCARAARLAAAVLALSLRDFVQAFPAGLLAH